MDPTSAPSLPLPDGIQRDIALAPYTTLGVGGPADYLATPHSVAHLQSLLVWARQHALPIMVLGEGSNLVVHDAGFRGLVLRFVAQDHARAQMERLAPEVVCATVPAGAPWCATVQHICEESLYGVEALYGIPGTSGAAPVQNIGAYGQDVSQTLAAVDVVDLATGDPQTLPASACGLGYRTSHFRGLWAGRYIITSLRLTLATRRKQPLRYPALVQALAAQGLDPLVASPAAVSQAVWRVREARGMVWLGSDAPWGTVGSFFTNPTVPESLCTSLLAQHPAMPYWPGARPGTAKLSAAWLIEASGFTKGWRCAAAGHRAGLSPLHALALINLGGATAADLCHAGAIIVAEVETRLGVTLRAEAQPVGFAYATPPFG